MSPEAHEGLGSAKGREQRPLHVRNHLSSASGFPAGAGSSGFGTLAESTKALTQHLVGAATGTGDGWEAAAPTTEIENLRYRERTTADRLGTCPTKNDPAGIGVPALQRTATDAG